jgi:TRAP-type mannitol/chloroaromatic compound transport system permease small subunit
MFCFSVTFNYSYGTSKFTAAHKLHVKIDLFYSIYNFRTAAKHGHIKKIFSTPGRWKYFLIK